MLLTTGLGGLKAAPVEHLCSYCIQLEDCIKVVPLTSRTRPHTCTSTCGEHTTTRRNNPRQKSYEEMHRCQLFQQPKNISTSEKVAFSSFLENVEDGRVVQVEIKGNEIRGILSDGSTFETYAPNDPNLVERLSAKGVSITAIPIEDKMPSLLGVLLSWFPMLLLIGCLLYTSPSPRD